MAKRANPKNVEALKHDDAKRKNIPTAEYRSVVQANLQEAKTLRYPRNTDLDPQLVWRGKDEQDWSDLVVQAPPLYIQEKVHPKVLIEDLMRRSKPAADGEGEGAQADLFGDFNGISEGADKTEFYQHDQNWSNRMILGDSLQVMASLAEREGLRGKVQCVYFDPPYGINFRSNFQWSTTSRDVMDGKADHITREPEQVKAFRDTWRDGIHSYLTYLRDRLTVARDLLSDSGSIFVQIGDENLHLVRSLLDEVFGVGNFVSVVTIKKTGGQTSTTLSAVSDYLVFYAKNIAALKFHQPHTRITAGQGASTGERYDQVLLPNGEMRRVLDSDFTTPGIRFFQLVSTSSNRPAREHEKIPITFDGRVFRPPTGRTWTTTKEGMTRLIASDRIYAGGSTLRYRRFLDDFSATAIGNLWTDVAGASGKVYVVQTATSVVQRCLLMATDPGDLVLDPTCGSGTTANVAEQWGRRWITIDTSRVALALARARIMGARYPYYLLADSRDGQQKEAEATSTAPSSQPVQGNIRHGFVYERVPHITLKSIANNTEIDVIWEQWQTKLEPLLNQLNAALKWTWQEWEIPLEADAKWPAQAKKLHADWWRARIARQQEIDKSIAAKAEFELLYDKPYEDKKTERVAGPFTVESLSPHRMLGLDENDELIDGTKETGEEFGAKQTFPQMILENLKVAGVQQAHKEDRITFTALSPWPGRLVCADGRYLEGEQEKRAAIFIGPEFGTVQRADLVEAAREAGDAGFDVLIACAFNYEAHATEFGKLGRLPVLKARMNADLHMAKDLKTTSKGNLFVIFGEPDVRFHLGGSAELHEEIRSREAKVIELEAELARLKAKKNKEPKEKERQAHVALMLEKHRRFFAAAGVLPKDLYCVEVWGVDVFKPQSGEVVSDDTSGIACWFVDSDYNEESFFVRQAYFLGASDPYKSLKTTLKAEIDAEAWETLHSDISVPFDRPANGRIAVKVINHLGDEVMKVYRV